MPLRLCGSVCRERAKRKKTTEFPRRSTINKNGMYCSRTRVQYMPFLVIREAAVKGGQLRQHRTIPALRLKHRSGSCGTASALPKCSIMSGCGTRIVLRGQKPLALCDRCPCFGSLFPPLAALTFAASSIICAFGLAAAAPRSPYRHLELCGIALSTFTCFILHQNLLQSHGSGRPGSAWLPAYRFRWKHPC